MIIPDLSGKPHCCSGCSAGTSGTANKTRSPNVFIFPKPWIRNPALPQSLPTRVIANPLFQRVKQPQNIWSRKWWILFLPKCPSVFVLNCDQTDFLRTMISSFWASLLYSQASLRTRLFCRWSSLRILGAGNGGGYFLPRMPHFLKIYILWYEGIVSL